MTKDKALKLALEALESDYVFEWPAMQRPERVKKKRFEAITAIKEALAPTSTQCEVQPEQKPVGRISADCEGILRQEVMLYTDKPLKIGTAVYTAAPKRPWVGLTEQEVTAIDKKYYRPMGPKEFAKEIEDALRSKNT